MNTKERKYTEEFKKQIVELYENDKSVIDLAREYGLVEQPSFLPGILSTQKSGINMVLVEWKRVIMTPQ